MSVDLQVLVSVASALLIAVIIFRGVVWKLTKLAGRTALSGVFLAVLAQLSGWTGLHLGVNLVNALVMGVLGVPGFALLCVLSHITA